MRQLCITPVMGKRLIGKGMAQHPHVQAILNHGKLVVIAGTTNGYVAEEILSALGQAEGFTRKGFRRGVTVAPEAGSRTWSCLVTSSSSTASGSVARRSLTWRTTLELATLYSRAPTHSIPTGRQPSRSAILRQGQSMPPSQRSMGGVRGSSSLWAWRSASPMTSSSWPG